MTVLNYMAAAVQQKYIIFYVVQDKIVHEITQCTTRVQTFSKGSFESKVMKLKVFFENIRYLKVIKQQIQKKIFQIVNAPSKRIPNNCVVCSWIMRMNKIIQRLMEVNPFRYTFPLLKKYMYADQYRSRLNNM